MSHRWQDWKNEVVWMSLYFSVAVWISIALVHAPVPESRVAVGQRKRVAAIGPAGYRRAGPCAQSNDALTIEQSPPFERPGKQSLDNASRRIPV